VPPKPKRVITAKPLTANTLTAKLVLQKPFTANALTAKTLYCESVLLRTALLRKCFTADIFSILIFHTLINFGFLISEYNSGKTFNNFYNYKNSTGSILFSDIIIILMNQSIEI